MLRQLRFAATRRAEGLSRPLQLTKKVRGDAVALQLLTAAQLEVNRVLFLIAPPRPSWEFSGGKLWMKLLSAVTR